MSRAARKARRARLLRFARLERADVEAVALEPIGRAALADLCRAHDDPAVSEDEFRERAGRWFPALRDMDRMSRLKFSWLNFRHGIRSATGRDPSFVEFVDLLNAHVLEGVFGRGAA